MRTGETDLIVALSPAAPRPRQDTGRFATNSRGDHLRRMAQPRIVRFLAIVAVLLMPFGMLGGMPARASAQHASMTMSAGHCAGMPDMPAREKKAPGAPCCDCMVACAAIHSKESCIEHEAVAPMAAQAAVLALAIRGLHPEAATPPPRIA